jgi:hypothetical protein
MYLKKNIFLGHEFEEKKVKVAHLLGLPTDARAIEVAATVAYWRKAGSVHNWFVQNVQNGVDDCGDHYVSRDKLKQLLDNCCEAVEDYFEWRKIPKRARPEYPRIAAKLVPASYEYDEDWLEELQETIETINEVLQKNPPSDPGLFSYQASW